MQRYFVSSQENNLFLLNKDDSHHVINVMRMNLSDRVEIVYNSTLYLASITSLSYPVKCEIIETLGNYQKIIPNVIIAQALVKEQKMDYILQKSCELGVYQIIPLESIRSVVKMDKNDNKKIVRWNKILKEASEQSKRLDIPNVTSLMNIKELIYIDAKYKFLCSVNETSKTIKSVLSNVNISDTILFVIGPEGGFDPKEEEFLINNGFSSISLGNNVLRTETASSYILSVINYEFLR